MRFLKLLLLIGFVTPAMGQSFSFDSMQNLLVHMRTGPTPSPTWTPSYTPTVTNTVTASYTATATYTFTPTFTPTNTPLLWNGTPTTSATATPTYTATSNYTSTSTFTPTASLTFTPSFTPTWTLGPLSDALPMPQNAWAYTTGGEATLPANTVSSAQHFLTITGSKYRTIAIKKIKLALLYDNQGASGGIGGSQPFQFSIRNPDTAPATHMVNPSISKLDVNAPTSNAALTFSYSAPLTQGSSLGASEYTFIKITPYYEQYWNQIFPATTPVVTGVSNTRGYSNIPVVWDDDNGRSPFIVRGQSQNFCISIPASWMVGTGVTTYLDYIVEWVEY